MTDTRTSGPRTIPRWLVLAGAVAAVAAALALLFVGVQASSDLARARAALVGRQTELTSASTELATTEASVASAHEAKDGRSKEASDLKGRVDEQAACIRAQQAALGRLDEIQKNLIDNGNRLAEGSTFAKAGDKRADALGDALDAYYQAALARAEGRTSAARTWLAKARSYEKQEAAQRKVQNQILAEVDATSGEIDQAFASVDAQLAETRRTCGTGS